MYSEKGQTLMELVVVVGVSAIVVGALVFATIASLRNAQFSKNQAQATKLAQEGIERVRAGRDRNKAISNFTTGSGNAVANWQDDDLWVNLDKNYYFNVAADGVLTYLVPQPAQTGIAASGESIGSFYRIVILSDDAAFSVQKTVTVQVSWTDFSGPHQSKLTTILRKL